MASSERVAIVTGTSVCKMNERALRCAEVIYPVGNGRRPFSRLREQRMVSRCGRHSAARDAGERARRRGKILMCNAADYDSQAEMFQKVWEKWGRINALCANVGIVDRNSIYIFGHCDSDKEV